MRRGRHRRRNEGLPSLHGIAGRQQVRRMVVGKLRAQLVPLHGKDALGLFYLALGRTTGMRHCPVRMALRRPEQHERQHNEKPRQDRALPHRALSCLPVHGRAFHPCAAQT